MLEVCRKSGVPLAGVWQSAPYVSQGTPQSPVPTTTRMRANVWGQRSLRRSGSVSYTHLTLPTMCSV
eukprot:922921-Alexandrium_andersonii.AAC.1